jgi:hypothetical protein
MTKLLSAKTVAIIRKSSQRMLPDVVSISRYPAKNDGHALVTPVIALNVPCNITVGMVTVRDGDGNTIQYDGEILFTYLPQRFGIIQDHVRNNDYLTWEGITYRVIEMHESKTDGVIIGYDGKLLLGNPQSGG